MKDYSEKNELIHSFFDYFYQDNPYIKRQQELMKRTFQRKSLYEHLRKYNKQYNCSDETMNNIDKLVNDSSVVVVGGQQAGILTGPLYTIHKIVTILKLAKEQEEKLGIPVVPIFWVAGEDHDFDEINHTYTIQKGKLQKLKVKQQNNNKQSVSDLPLDKRALEIFTEEVLKHCKETQETCLLLTEIKTMIQKSRSYVDFFNFFIHKLFKNRGIVLLDSHHKELRQMEKPYFKQMISSNDLLNDCFLEKANALFNEGYGEPIERSENNAHLFYHYQGSRLLLERTSSNMFRDKHNIVSFTKEELLEQVETNPQNFSNNVVTRPIMQEFLLPVLAFVGGPGEIAYWATLKESFHLFGLKMPPLVPRLSITIVNPQIDKWLNECNLSAIDIMKNGTSSVRNQLPFWDDKERIDETLYQVLDKVEELHEPLKDLVNTYDKGLEALAHKNELMIKKEIHFFVQKIEKSVRQKYDHDLLKFDLIDAYLFPNNGLQERCLNIVQFLNKYGFEFIEKLIELPFDINESHKIIYVN